MIISSPSDFRLAARRKLPKFLFDYIDGGSFSEATLARNVDDFGAIELRQRVLQGTTEIDLQTDLFGERLNLPIALSPVGLTGMCARRGEVQAALAAEAAGIPFTLSTVSVCPIEEVVGKGTRPIWFQLYVLRDRDFMKNALERAIAAGVQTLVFTVDMPVPGTRYRDRHSGMSGPGAPQRRMWQALGRPSWALDVGLLGRPHDLGNISAYRGRRTDLSDYIGWLGKNFEPGIGWQDLEWIRDFWPGNLLIKGILDPPDVEHAIRLGADGLIVSNHGGRQLDGVPSTIQALPGIVTAARGRTKIILDSGVRSGLDVVRAICLGADSVMIGRPYIFALAAGGTTGVQCLLEHYAAEMRVAMTLMGAKNLAELTTQMVARQPR